MKRLSMWTAGMLLATSLLLPTHRAAAQGFVVVVNEAGPASLPRSELTKIFLRKSPELVAVDQRKESPARSAFSRSVLGRPVAAIASYWQQQIFSGGEAPPVEKGSDGDVLAYVRANPKAVGYVAAGTELGGGVKALDVR